MSLCREGKYTIPAAGRLLDGAQGDFPLCMPSAGRQDVDLALRAGDAL